VEAVSVAGGVAMAAGAEGSRHVRAKLVMTSVGTPVSVLMRLVPESTNVVVR
jgi:hypothetical protein